MIPTLSCLSVSNSLVSCLRNRCSVSYLSISPLHDTFRQPQLYSSPTVSMAIPLLSNGLSPLTYQAACAPFKPNKSGQRLDPTYYRGCWHVVSRSLFLRYRQIRSQTEYSSRTKAVYNAERLPPARGMAGSDFRPLTNIPYCCLP